MNKNRHFLIHFHFSNDDDNNYDLIYLFDYKLKIILGELKMFILKKNINKCKGSGVLLKMVMMIQKNNN